MQWKSSEIVFVFEIHYFYFHTESFASTTTWQRRGEPLNNEFLRNSNLFRHPSYFPTATQQNISPPSPSVQSLTARQFRQYFSCEYFGCFWGESFLCEWLQNWKMLNDKPQLQLKRKLFALHAKTLMEN